MPQVPMKTPAVSEKNSSANKINSGNNPIGFGYGHIGTATKIREYEDRHFYGNIQTASRLKITLAIVADGVGGGNLGQRASQLTVDTIVEYCKLYTGNDILQMMGKAIGEANRRVFDEGQTLSSKQDMSSTVAFAVIYDNRLYIANVGDSRIYLIRDHKVQQITYDHTWANERIREGKLSQAEANSHPNAGLLARSVGHEPRVRVDLGLYLKGGTESSEEALNQQGLALTPNDIILVCSDGLIKSRRDGPGNFVENREILEVAEGGTAEQAAKTLVDLAIGRNADDNVTAVIVEFPGRKRGLRNLLPRLQISTPAAIILSLAICLVFTGSVWWLIDRGGDNTPLPTPNPGSAYLVDGKILDQSTNAYLESGSSIFFNTQATLKADQGLVSINLPGNYLLYLYGTTENPTIIQLIRGADLAQNQDETVLHLHRGTVLVLKAPGTDKQIRVTVETIMGKAINDYGKMGVIFHADSQILIVDCFEKNCQIQAGDTFRVLTSMQSGKIDAAGTTEVLNQIDSAMYQDFKIPGLMLAEPTSTLLTATPMLPPTVTASPTRPFEAGEQTATSTPKPGVRPSQTPTGTATQPIPTLASPTIPPPTPTNTVQPTNTMQPTKPPRPIKTIIIIIPPTFTPTPEGDG